MISVESSSERMFWNIIFHTLNAEKTKTKKKVLKVTIKTAVPYCVFYIFMYFLRHNIMVFTNKSLQKMI